MDDRLFGCARDSIRTLNANSLMRGEGKLEALVISPGDWTKLALETLADGHLLVSVG